MSEALQAKPKLCGSTFAHMNCRFSGAIEGKRHHCIGGDHIYADCPYHDPFGMITSRPSMRRMIEKDGFFILEAETVK